MTNSEGMAELIATLETIVGQHFHNEQKRGGFFYRYPVRFEKDGTEYECKGMIPDLTPDELPTVRYKTGANSLYIGSALYQVLQFLEDRYKGKIDFTALEMDYQMFNKPDAPFSNPFDLFDDLFFDDLFGGIGEVDEDE